jgi:hypothetical protein
MTCKFSLILLFVLLLISPKLAAGGESRYPVLDSKFPAAEAKLGWIDNERVIFHGYDIGKMTQPGPGEGHPTAAEALFIWDTVKETVTKYWDVEGPVPLCVFRGQVFFTQKIKDKENSWLTIIGSFGKEEQRLVSQKLWINGFSCREAAHKPEWVKEDKHRRWGLIEEHGYLDFGESSPGDPAKASPILLYQPNKTQGLQLPFTGKQIRLHLTYSEFDNSYLIEEQRRTTYAGSVWRLKPDGTVSKVLEPTGQSWERIGWDRFQLTQKGLFLSGGRGDYASVGTSGGYLLVSAQGVPRRLVAGTVRNEMVSPNGCKVAFIHVLHSQAGADSVKALREGKPGARTLKMIDLCSEKGE